MTGKARIGVIGTSWWADAMYLPALCDHPDAVVVAICGRNEKTLQERAAKWNIPETFTSVDEMLEKGTINAVLIASSNDTHYTFAKKVLAKRLHMLLEKPICNRIEEARELAELCRGAPEVNTMVPFTYSMMPVTRYIKELVESDYIGKPYHLNLRYYANYGRESNQYVWRFDKSRAGAGCVADIASHFIYLAVWYFGSVSKVSALLSKNVSRALLNDAGEEYEVADDAAIVTLQFANGAQGVVHASTVCHEENVFGQTQHFDLNGSKGTIRGMMDYDLVQEVWGASGSGPVKKLEMPDHIWGSCRRGQVHDTYKDIFRKEMFMSREWAADIAAGRKSQRPTFEDGLEIQEIIHACLLSAEEERWVDVGPAPNKKRKASS